MSRSSVTTWVPSSYLNKVPREWDDVNLSRKGIPHSSRFWCKLAGTGVSAVSGKPDNCINDSIAFLNREGEEYDMYESGHTDDTCPILHFGIDGINFFAPLPHPETDCSISQEENASYVTATGRTFKAPDVGMLCSVCIGTKSYLCLKNVGGLKNPWNAVIDYGDDLKYQDVKIGCIINTSKRYLPIKGYSRFGLEILAECLINASVTSRVRRGDPQRVFDKKTQTVIALPIGITPYADSYLNGDLQAVKRNAPLVLSMEILNKFADNATISAAFGDEQSGQSNEVDESKVEMIFQKILSEAQAFVQRSRSTNPLKSTFSVSSINGTLTATEKTSEFFQSGRRPSPMGDQQVDVTESAVVVLSDLTRGQLRYREYKYSQGNYPPRRTLSIVSERGLKRNAFMRSDAAWKSPKGLFNELVEPIPKTIQVLELVCNDKSVENITRIHCARAHLGLLKAVDRKVVNRQIIDKAARVNALSILSHAPITGTRRVAPVEVIPKIQGPIGSPISILGDGTVQVPWNCGINVSDSQANEAMFLRGWTDYEPDLGFQAAIMKGNMKLFCRGDRTAEDNLKKMLMSQGASYDDNLPNVRIYAHRDENAPAFETSRSNDPVSGTKNWSDDESKPIAPPLAVPRPYRFSSLKERYLRCRNGPAHWLKELSCEPALSEKDRENFIKMSSRERLSNADLSKYAPDVILDATDIPRDENFEDFHFDAPMRTKSMCNWLNKHGRADLCSKINPTHWSPQGKINRVARTRKPRGRGRGQGRGRGRGQSRRQGRYQGKEPGPRYSQRMKRFISWMGSPRTGQEIENHAAQINVRNPVGFIMRLHREDPNRVIIRADRDSLGRIVRTYAIVQVKSGLEELPLTTMMVQGGRDVPDISQEMNPPRERQNNDTRIPNHPADMRVSNYSAETTQAVRSMVHAQKSMNDAMKAIMVLFGIGGIGGVNGLDYCDYTQGNCTGNVVPMWTSECEGFTYEEVSFCDSNLDGCDVVMNDVNSWGIPCTLICSNSSIGKCKWDGLSESLYNPELYFDLDPEYDGSEGCSGAVTFLHREGGNCSKTRAGVMVGTPTRKLSEVSYHATLTDGVFVGYVDPEVVDYEWQLSLTHLVDAVMVCTQNVPCELASELVDRGALIYAKLVDLNHADEAIFGRYYDEDGNSYAREMDWLDPFSALSGDTSSYGNWDYLTHIVVWLMALSIILGVGYVLGIVSMLIQLFVGCGKIRTCCLKNRLLSRMLKRTEVLTPMERLMSLKKALYIYKDQVTTNWTPSAQTLSPGSTEWKNGMKYLLKSLTVSEILQRLGVTPMADAAASPSSPVAHGIPTWWLVILIVACVLSQARGDPCGDPSLVSDGICQDVVNNPDCGWDGGDCCDPFFDTTSCTLVRYQTVTDCCRDPTNAANDMIQYIMSAINLGLSERTALAQAIATQEGVDDAQSKNHSDLASLMNQSLGVMNSRYADIETAVDDNTATCDALTTAVTDNHVDIDRIDGSLSLEIAETDGEIDEIELKINSLSSSIDQIWVQTNSSATGASQRADFVDASIGLIQSEVNFLGDSLEESTSNHTSALDSLERIQSEIDATDIIISQLQAEVDEIEAELDDVLALNVTQMEMDLSDTMADLQIALNANELLHRRLDSAERDVYESFEASNFCSTTVASQGVSVSVSDGTASATFSDLSVDFSGSNHQTVCIEAEIPIVDSSVSTNTSFYIEIEKVASKTVYSLYESYHTGAIESDHPADWDFACGVEEVCEFDVNWEAIISVEVALADPGTCAPLLDVADPTFGGYLPSKYASINPTNFYGTAGNEDSEVICFVGCGCYYARWNALPKGYDEQTSSYRVYELGSSHEVYEFYLSISSESGTSYESKIVLSSGSSSSIDLNGTAVEVSLLGGLNGLDFEFPSDYLVFQSWDETSNFIGPGAPYGELSSMLPGGWIQSNSPDGLWSSATIASDAVVGSFTDGEFTVQIKEDPLQLALDQLDSETSNYYGPGHNVSVGQLSFDSGSMIIDRYDAEPFVLAVSIEGALEFSLDRSVAVPSFCEDPVVSGQYSSASGGTVSFSARIADGSGAVSVLFLESCPDSSGDLQQAERLFPDSYVSLSSECTEVSVAFTAEQSEVTGCLVIMDSYGSLVSWDKREFLGDLYPPINLNSTEYIFVASEVDLPLVEEDPSEASSSIDWVDIGIGCGIGVVVLIALALIIKWRREKDKIEPPITIHNHSAPPRKTNSYRVSWNSTAP